MARATSSLPVPLSPRTWTQASLGRDQGDPFEDFLHGRAGADDQPGRVFLCGRRTVVSAGRALFFSAFDRALGHGQVERFGQVVEGPVSHGGDGGGEFAVGGHHDDRHARRGFLEMLHGRQAVHARQADIEHDHVRPRLAAAARPCSAETAVAAVWPSCSASFARPQQMLCSSSTMRRWDMMEWDLEETLYVPESSLIYEVSIRSVIPFRSTSCDIRKLGHCDQPKHFKS